jgi:hypothetical protein
VPAGFVNSAGQAAFDNFESHVVGQADDGAPETAEAWLWSVDKEGVTDEPLSAITINLPTDVTLRSATAIGPFERIVGWYTTTGRGGRGGGTGPHAFVLTPVVQEIPTLGGWGMGVMTLLLLSAAALVLGRRRAVRPPAA